MVVNKWLDVYLMVFGVMIGCTLCHLTSLSTSPNWCDIFSIMVCI